MILLLWFPAALEVHYSKPNNQNSCKIILQALHFVFPWE